MLKAYKNKRAFSNDRFSVSADFTNITSDIVAYISGHNHRDASVVSDNTLFISTTCDACYSDDGHGGVIGTITESAFDVYCINKANKILKAIRIGRGSDREWTY